MLFIGWCSFLGSEFCRCLFQYDFSWRQRVVVSILWLYLSYNHPILILWDCFAGYINLFCLLFISRAWNVSSTFGWLLYCWWELWYRSVFVWVDHFTVYFKNTISFYTVVSFSSHVYLGFSMDNFGLLWKPIFLWNVTTIISLIRLFVLLVFKHSSLYLMNY